MPEPHAGSAGDEPEPARRRNACKSEDGCLPVTKTDTAKVQDHIARARGVGEVVLQIHSCSNVPDMDKVFGIGRASDVSDCFVKLRLRDSQGKLIAKAQNTLTIRDNLEPVFGLCFRSMPVPAEDDDYLEVKLYDEDHISNDYIGTVAIQLSRLPEGGEIQSFPLEMKTSKRGEKDPSQPATIQLRRMLVLPTARRKTLFLIRHGESLWNVAQREKQPLGLLHLDHPLSGIGAEQCFAFNEFWRARVERHEQTREEQEFLDAKLVVVSPLTRTVETALLTLYEHPAVVERGIMLLRSIREIKGSRGSLDVVGMLAGADAIKQSALAELAKVSQSQALQDIVRRLQAVRVDGNDAENKWWTSKAGRDDPESVDQRIYDALATLQYTPEGSIICVGHSLFFREIIRRFVHPGSDFEQSDPEFVARLKRKKLGNAACLRVDMAFPLPAVGGGDVPPPEILDARLIFGTSLEGEEEEGEETDDGDGGETPPVEDTVNL